MTDSEIRLRLADHIKIILPRIRTKDFVEWISEDAQYSFYFYDALQSGACYKPAELAALILETIDLDALDGVGPFNFQPKGINHR